MCNGITIIILGGYIGINTLVKNALNVGSHILCIFGADFFFRQISYISYASNTAFEVFISLAIPMKIHEGKSGFPVLSTR